MNTTPTAKLKAILDLSHTHLEMKRKAINDTYKLDRIRTWQRTQAYGHVCLEIPWKRQIALMLIDHMVSGFVVKKIYSIVSTKRKELANNKAERGQSSDYGTGPW